MPTGDGRVGRLERRTGSFGHRRRSAAFAGPRPHPGLPEGSHVVAEIEHIVVLMMENHSYDNYFGWMQDHGDGFEQDAAGNPVPSVPNLDANGVPVPLRHRPTTKQQADVPTQSWAASHIQRGESNDGFVRSIEKTVTGADVTVAMQYFDGSDLPFYAQLARTFPLAVRWFCSCLGPTVPNRRYLISATSNGIIDDVSGLDDYPAAGTIFDTLSANGVSWADYHDKPTWKVVLPTLLGRRAHGVWRKLPLIIAGLLPGLEQLVAGKLLFSADSYPRNVFASWYHAPPAGQFFAQAERGDLPAVSVIDPDFLTYSEENPQDVRVGESFAASVIEAVLKSPCWPRTLLLWLHDEHGGYYDHVVPPPARPPDDVLATSLADRHRLLAKLPFLRPLVRDLERVDAGPRTFDRFGFRVPAVVVSPYAQPGAVCDTVFDHTSVLRLIEEVWNLPSLTRRDAAATSPLRLLDFTKPPAFLDPPPLPPPATPDAWRRVSLSTGSARN
jgi:phospholipase C